MDSAPVLNMLGAAFTFGLGAMALIRPGLAAAFTGIRPEGALGVSEIRATYGGLFFALGAFAIHSSSEVVFMVLGVAWLGAAAGRALSVLVDGSRGARNLAGIVFEAGVGALLLAR